MGLRDVSSTFSTVYAGKVTDIAGFKRDRAKLTFNTRDYFDRVNVKFPFSAFTQDVFPDIEDNLIGVVVPIIYGDVSAEEIAGLAEKVLSKESIFIASSDLSHYLSYEKAKQIDSGTINSILALDLKKFLSGGDACGKIGIAGLIILARKNKWIPVLLDYRNSGDTAGDKKGVVGYAAIAFMEKN